MSYGRDPDRATRGVGAIAAADGSPARRRMRSRVAARTQARDRAMAAVARGALGMAALSPASSKSGMTGAPTYLPGMLKMLPAVIAQPAPVATLPPLKIGVVTATAGGLVPTSSPAPAPVSAPAPVTTGTSTGGSSSTSSSGGGALSSGVAMGPPQVTVLAPLPDMPLPDLTDVTATPMTTAASAPVPDNTLRNALLIGGAVAVAAYFLYFRKREP